MQAYYWTRRNIDRLEEKLLELEAEATRQTAQLTRERKAKHHGHDRLAELVAEIADTREEINYQLQKAYGLVAKIEKAIEKLPEREKYLIRARYIDCKSWEQIAVDMCYSWRQIHYIHSESLKILSSADHCTQLHSNSC